MRLMIQLLRGRPPDARSKDRHTYHTAEHLRSLHFKNKDGEDIVLSQDEWTRLVAVGPYLSWAQCRHGPINHLDPLDYYSLNHRDFETFLMYENGDETIRDHFKLKVARQNKDKREKKVKQEEARRKKEEQQEEARRKKEDHDEERMRKKDAHEDRLMELEYQERQASFQASIDSIKSRRSRRSRASNSKKSNNSGSHRSDNSTIASVEQDQDPLPLSRLTLDNFDPLETHDDKIINRDSQRSKKSTGSHRSKGSRSHHSKGSRSKTKNASSSKPKDSSPSKSSFANMFHSTTMGGAPDDSPSDSSDSDFGSSHGSLSALSSHRRKWGGKGDSKGSNDGSNDSRKHRHGGNGGSGGGGNSHHGSNGNSRRSRRKKDKNIPMYASVRDVSAIVQAALAAFDKSVKRDPTHFPAFKRDYNFEKWWRSFCATCRMQRIHLLLDRHCKPEDEIETALWERLNDYGYAVLLMTVTVSQGATIVKRHENSGISKAQLVIRDIHEHYTGVASVAASQRREEAMTKLTTMRLSLSDVPLADQINSFHDVINTVNNLSSVAAELDSHQQLVHFKNFIIDVPDMEDAATFIDMALNFTSGISPEKAMTVYENRARIIDARRRRLLRSRKGIRRLESQMHDGQLTDTQLVNMLYAYDVNVHDIVNDDPEYDRQAFYGDIRGSLDQESWGMLSQLAKDKWDEIPDVDKNIFMGFGNIDRTSTRPNTRSRSGNGRSRRSSFNRGGRRQNDRQQTQDNAGTGEQAAHLTDIAEESSEEERVHDEAEDISGHRALSIVNDDERHDDSRQILALVRNPISRHRIEQVKDALPVGHPTRLLSNSMIEQTGQPSSPSAPAVASTPNKPVSALRKLLRFGKTPNDNTPKVTTYLLSVSSDGDSVGGGFDNLGSEDFDTTNSGIVDSGCSQGCAGDNLRHVAWTDDRVVIQGYGDTIPRHGYRIGTFAMVARNTYGQYVILVFPQYAGREDLVSNNVHTLHSALQLRHNSDLTLDDTPIAQGGQQVVVIGEHSFNLHFDNGRVIWPGRPFTDQEWDSLTKIVITDPSRWNPNQYNSNNPRPRSSNNRHYTPYGTFGNYGRQGNISRATSIWRSSYNEEFRRLRIGVNGETDEDSEDHESLPSLESYDEIEEYVSGDEVNATNIENDNDYGENLVVMDRLAHRISMVLVQDELTRVVDSVNERNIARGILQQLGTMHVPRRHGHVYTDTVYDPRGLSTYTDVNLIHDPWSDPRDPTVHQVEGDLSSESGSTTTDEELSAESNSDSDTHEGLDTGITYTVKHDGRIRARAVYVER